MGLFTDFLKRAIEDEKKAEKEYNEWADKVEFFHRDRRIQRVLRSIANSEFKHRRQLEGILDLLYYLEENRKLLEEEERKRHK